MKPLFDMHCHLDWFSHAERVAQDARHRGLILFANTVTPDGFVRAEGVLSNYESVIVGVGAHPWWIASGNIDDHAVEHATQLALEHPFIGEVGLDFSNAHTSAKSHGRQVEALEAILAACDAGARTNDTKLISLHAVRSACVVLDLLESTGCLTSCRCIFHWFSDTSDELHRAVQAGCFFSINEMMLRTRRGREYARQLPSERLLTETDLPPKKDGACDIEDIISSLDNTLCTLAEIRGEDVGDIVAHNASLLLTS